MTVREGAGRLSGPAPRWGLALAATVAALGASAGSASAAGPLPPDLRTLKPAEVRLFSPSEGQLVLRFSNEVANRGKGPLEIYPQPDYADCDGDGLKDDHLAFQRLYEDTNQNNQFDLGEDTDFTDTAVGCKVFHAPHNHWHFLNFASYKLRRESDGQRVAGSTKVSFCLLDGSRVYPSDPGSPAERQYPPECHEIDTQGLSVGWSDLYTYTTPGQRLDVSGLPRANYCLVSKADPKNLLSETDDGNNVGELRIRLHPHRQVVEELAGDCKS